MNTMNESKTYTVEEIFEDIPGDSENVVFKIPPEICEKMGWVEGDTIHISVTDGQMIFNKV